MMFPRRESRLLTEIARTHSVLRSSLCAQDGYPKDHVMATSDDDGDDASVSKLNALINGWKGVTLTLFDAMRMIGTAFDVVGEVQSALDASSGGAAENTTTHEYQQQLHKPEAEAEAPADGGGEEEEEEEDYQSDLSGYPDSDDDKYHVDEDEDDGVLPEDNKLNSDQLTRLYQNKARKGGLGKLLLEGRRGLGGLPHDKEEGEGESGVVKR